MSTIEELISRIETPTVRDELSREIAALKQRLDWGLVFERHLPESARLLNAPTRVGSVVWERRTTTPRRLRVRAIEGSDLLVVAEHPGTDAPVDAPTERITRADTMVEQNFAEPAFPVPTPMDALRNGPAEKPYHAVIEGENYHVLESLLATYARQVDVLYLDPPYNTGDRDWAYNNDYVDPNDAWRPSKWMAFMERRLRLGHRLLKPAGVMVVTIDQNEVHHLGMLLEQMFPDALVQMVTIAINPSGAAGDGFSRVDEYAFFLFFGGSQPNLAFEDFFGPEDKTRAEYWESLLRRGSSWLRAARPNLCYPILVDTDGHIAGVGERFEGDDESTRPTQQGEFELAWPVRTDGKLGIWRVDAVRLMSLQAKGYAVTTKRDPRRGTWSVRYLLDGAVQAIERGELEVLKRGPYGEVVLAEKGKGRVIPKTMWHRGRHAAGSTWGTNLLTALLGRGGAFSYPKSVYAVLDTLDAAAGGSKDALILDFFAGSGTTLHATMLLNARDGGSRRCVLVTNNELNYAAASRLMKQGHFAGDPEFEAAGVFEAATKPRVTAAVTGVRPDGQPAEGTYLDGRDYAEGFEENVEFYRLDYLDPGEVEFGLRFAEIHPLLWLRAGGVGQREDLDPTKPLGLPAASPYAVLFDPSGMTDLLAALPGRPDIKVVFIVADSADAYAQLVSDLPRDIGKVRLYRDYLETLRRATS